MFTSCYTSALHAVHTAAAGVLLLGPCIDPAGMPAGHSEGLLAHTVAQVLCNDTLGQQTRHGLHRTSTKEGAQTLVV